LRAVQAAIGNSNDFHACKRAKVGQEAAAAEAAGADNTDANRPVHHDRASNEPLTGLRRESYRSLDPRDTYGERNAEPAGSILEKLGSDMTQPHLRLEQPAMAQRALKRRLHLHLAKLPDREAEVLDGGVALIGEVFQQQLGES
jgi:hypothetical protein